MAKLNALGVTVRFLAYCIKFTTQKTNVYELSYPKCIGVWDSCRNFRLMRTLLSFFLAVFLIQGENIFHWIGDIKIKTIYRADIDLMCLLRIIRILLATLKGKEFQLIQSSFLVHLSKLKHHVFFLTKRNSIVSST